MSDDSLFQTIRFCRSQMEAEVLRLKLENAGIDAHVLDSQSGLALGGLSPQNDGVRLQVLTEDWRKLKK